MSINGVGTRLTQAMDLHPRAPRGKHGRLTWLRNELAYATKVDVTVETVRKWMQGETVPRPARVAALARILGVDVGWLATGSGAGAERQNLAPHTRSGVVLLVAGLLELAGARVAFPETDDFPESDVDLYAIKDGRHLRIRVLVTEVDQRGDAVFGLPLPKPAHSLLGVAVHRGLLMPTVLDLREVEFESKGGRAVAVIPSVDFAGLAPRTIGDLL